ncbi:hypothetical protein [Ruthenibacterium lactatiformans]|uniref:Heparin-sulfate lyase N-terminal domain-containing protein n=1 Tax=Ruthenibacterium lactatiformans TaxID=1550024 RepID=A0A6L6LXM9_9FIRM|nr:hypothetical protein [Ruthenibacterium lactatiformans]MTQ81654.1 hypothetical protein [Ruthenibacterium lactatiformans]MTS28574.1 hypothetical protein [Ruthenibacterium lactatiformans]MTS32285.1 hypothetical protein [Ruthenibacterium lactatiformans]MTS38874.1 hypothetical protein [Ruthenibacterium lactatiformans]MTS43085.1 hypothetical protein [Ruthenibacterium lactatiformans]
MKFDGIEITNAQFYIDLIRRCADEHWESYENQDYMDFQKDIQVDTAHFSSTTTLTVVFGKVQYGYALQACAETFKHTGEQKYADMGLTYIRRIVEIYEWVRANTKLTDHEIDSLQLIEGGFAAGPFLKGCMILHDKGVLQQDLLDRLMPAVECSIRFGLRMVEWGPFNRNLLKVTVFDRFSKLFPNSRYAEKTAKMAKFLIEDSIGRWNMEDTLFYNGIWYICTLEYFLENGIRNFRTETVFRYYAVCAAHLQLPEGSLPDYGDNRPRDFGCVALGIGFYEWCASHFNDGEIRYFASKFVSWANEYYKGAIASGWLVRSYAVAADALLQNDVQPQKPDYISGEVIEDLVGKKMVFRGSDGDYLLCNYRDEGNYALTARQNMYCTIPAPAEKVHHGHSDENAIIDYTYKGKFLLSDGGYRDQICTDGHYRADFYHNKMIVRNGRMFYEDKNFIQHIRNIGTYLKVETQKVFYYHSGNVEASRTRLDDTRHHRDVQDRTIIHFVKENMYAVIDTVKAAETYEYTLGPVWHGGKVHKTGETDFLVVQTADILQGPSGTEDLNLRVGFVRKDLPTDVQKMRRLGIDDQESVAQYFSEYLVQGEYIHFVTLLMPEQTAEDKARNSTILASASCQQVAGGKALEFNVEIDGVHYTFGMKMDETYGFTDYKHRPTYSFDAGKASYGKFTTDALFAFFAEDEKCIDYAAWMVSRVDYDGKTSFASEQTQFSNNDLSNNPGAINHARWEDHIQK